MSERRDIGDIVILKEVSSLVIVTDSLIARILEPQDELAHLVNNYPLCVICEDLDCIRWTDLEILSADLIPTGDRCHNISECEMENFYLIRGTHKEINKT